jgi:hypothetical protein
MRVVCALWLCVLSYVAVSPASLTLVAVFQTSSKMFLQARHGNRSKVNAGRSSLPVGVQVVRPYKLSLIFNPVPEIPIFCTDTSIYAVECCSISRLVEPGRHSKWSPMSCGELVFNITCAHVWEELGIDYTTLRDKHMIQRIKNCLNHSAGSNRNFTTVVVFTTGGPSHVLFLRRWRSSHQSRRRWFLNLASQMCVRCEGRYWLRKSGTCYDFRTYLLDKCHSEAVL